MKRLAPEESFLSQVWTLRAFVAGAWPTSARPGQAPGTDHHGELSPNGRRVRSVSWQPRRSWGGDSSVVRYRRMLTGSRSPVFAASRNEPSPSGIASWRREQRKRNQTMVRAVKLLMDRREALRRAFADELSGRSGPRLTQGKMMHDSNCAEFEARAAAQPLEQLRALCVARRQQTDR